MIVFFDIHGKKLPNTPTHVGSMGLDLSAIASVFIVQADGDELEQALKILGVSSSCAKPVQCFTDFDARKIAANFK